MRLGLLTVLLLSACGADETLRAYGARDRDWHLQSIDGTPFAARGTLRFGDRGALSGEGPCNQLSGKQLAPYPWFQVKELTSTRRACPELVAEGQFLAALEAMTLAEVSGDVLVLSTPEGREMVFAAK